VSSSYPKKSKLFQAWAKAMVAGATVDNPDYSSSGGKMMAKRRRKKRKRRRRKKNAKD